MLLCCCSETGLVSSIIFHLYIFNLIFFLQYLSAFFYLSNDVMDDGMMRKEIFKTEYMLLM